MSDPHVSERGLDLRQTGRLLGGPQLAVCLLGDLQEPPGVTTGQDGLPAAARETLGRELAHRLKQGVARVRSAPVDPD
jgi:hypothetical protein